MRIFILHEKNEIRVFNAATEEIRDRNALAVLRERLKGGWYTKPDMPKPFDMTDEQIEAMPEGPSKTMIQIERAKCQQRRSEYEKAQVEWLEIQTADRLAHGRMAWKLLRERSRRGCEYEGIEVGIVEGVSS